MPRLTTKTVIDGTDKRLADTDFVKEEPEAPRPTRDYMVVADKRKAEEIREAMGRRYARSLGKPWPIPGTPIGGGVHGDGRTWWYQEMEELKTGEYAFRRDATLDAMKGEEEDTDGTKPTEGLLVIGER